MPYKRRRPDHSGPLGARILARAIEQHWARRGHAVVVKVVPLDNVCDENGKTLWTIRSDLRAGLPSARAT